MACGNEVAPTSGPSSATPSIRSTAPREADATQIPAGPATAAFLERARAVEQAVRAAGLPKPREGIFLYSSLAPELGFDTIEQKAAWGAGYVSIAPGLQGASGGTTRIDFGDGSSRSVTVLEPRPALTQAIGTPYDNCGHMAVPASKCKLTITGASLKTVDVDTSNGRATVPAWSFTAKGLSRPIVVLAVSTEVLQPLVEPTPPPGLDQRLEPSLVQVGWLTGVDDRTLTFILNYGTCDRDLRAHVLELKDMVIIGGSHSPLRGCGEGVGASTPATVTLTEPLGDRAVISAATGGRLTLYPHIQ
ncbi:hypothetical protein [Kribbella sp. VKM Ac-2571]|uniref:hypothetical protein n=1 Tax=Kribbella sp. VKM Ac-2571 TaxID=2512222 RepID=UPI0010615227|nr:hypothetical protein [Kribbella sp. VKM Ac-2571]